MTAPIPNQADAKRRPRFLLFFLLTPWAETRARRLWFLAVLSLPKRIRTYRVLSCMAMRTELNALVARRKTLRGRCEIRDAQGVVVSMEDKPSPRCAQRQGHVDVVLPSNRCAHGEATVAVSCGNTGALMAVSHDPPAQIAGRQPPCHCRAVAQPQSAGVQRDAGCRGRCARRCPTTAAVCADGRVLCAQRHGPCPPPYRIAECRHRRAQRPPRTERGL